MSRNPDGWVRATLSELAEVVGGGTPSRSEPAYWGGEIPWATPSDVTKLQGRHIDRTASTITASGLAASGARVLPPGSVLMTSRATIGACAVNTVPMATNQGFQSLVPTSATCTEYLYYLAQFVRPELERRAAGSTFREVSRNAVRSVPVSVPPLGEQRRIAAVLSAVDQVLERDRAVFDELRLLESLLTQRFLTEGLPGAHSSWKTTAIGRLPASWGVRPLGELAEVERGKFSHRPRGDPRLYGGPYPFIQTGDVTACSGRIRRFSQTLNADGLAVSRLFPAGTVVVTIAANIGETGVAEIDVAFPDSLVGVRCGAQLHNRFLELALRMRKKELSDAAPQSAQKNINLETLRPLLVPVPPLEEQKRIAEIVRAVSDRADVELAMLNHLQVAKGALAQALLTGQVRTPNEA